MFWNNVLEGFGYFWWIILPIIASGIVWFVKEKFDEIVLVVFICSVLLNIIIILLGPALYWSVRVCFMDDNINYDPGEYILMGLCAIAGVLFIGLIIYGVFKFVAADDGIKIKLDEDSSLKITSTERKKLKTKDN